MPESNITVILSRIANYLPLAGGTLTGDLTIGSNAIKTTNHLIKELNSNDIALRNVGDTAYIQLNVLNVNIQNGGRIYMEVNATSIDAREQNGAYFLIKVRDTDVGQVEVARAQGDVDPEFQIGNNGNALRGSNAGLLGLWGHSPAVQPAAEADPTDLATCIVAITSLIDKFQAVGILAT